MIKAARRVQGKDLRDLDAGRYILREKCEAGTPLCSNQLVQRYGVNGSAEEGTTFLLCGPCSVYLKRGGTKLQPA